MTRHKPLSNRQSAPSGLFLLVAGFVSLVVVNTALPASVTNNPAAHGSVQRSVS